MGHARFWGFAFSILAIVRPTAAAEPVTIPLKDVWAYGMPGTRDLSELEGSQTLVEPLLEHLNKTWDVKRGMAVVPVQGEGLPALQQFDDATLGKDQPAPIDGATVVKRHRVPVYSDGPISLVFVTKPTKLQVELQSVEWINKRIWIRYRYAPREADEAAPQLALIPMGKLPPASYVVTVERTPMEKKHLEAGHEEPPQERPDKPSSKVSGGCFFEVIDKEDAAAAAKPMSIPLKDIWAYRMPGTRDINELASPKGEESLVETVLKQIRGIRSEDHGMAVLGEGVDALRAFHRIRTEGLSRNQIAFDAPVSLVFFTKSQGWYVHLMSVEKAENSNRFTIRYRFVPHETAESTQHLAVIPLGKLPPGKYTVRVERAAMEKTYLDLGFPEPPPQQIAKVSGSFGFIVLERR